MLWKVSSNGKRALWKKVELATIWFAFDSFIHSFTSWLCFFYFPSQSKELEKARVEGWAWKRKYSQENGASNNISINEDSDVDDSDGGGDNVDEGEVAGENDNDDMEMEDSKLTALQADSSDEDLLKEVEVVAI